MVSEVPKLVNKFIEISNNGWIEGVNNYSNSIGLTFEKELGKKADSLYFPDYHGIEIKCSSRYSRYPIYLFSIAFDGPTFPEINRIVDKYGWFDHEFVNKKILMTRIRYKSKTKIQSGFQFKFELDEQEEKLYLCVYDMEGILIEKESFIYLSSIYNHLCLKLSNLAIIYASTKKDSNKKYHRYYEINVYKLISFDRFIELLKNDDIGVSFLARLGRSGDNKGKYKNKSLTFELKKEDVFKLYSIEYYYNSDTEQEFSIFENYGTTNALV